MKNLVINVAKNQVINELVCTPNSIILAKQTISERNGEINTSVRYIEVCQTDKTDDINLVKTLLKYCISEFLVCSELERDFKDCNIKQRKLFNQFLSTNKIYRSNSEGKIVSALESEVPFSQTALRVKDYHTIANCKKENLKAAIHQHAKAILSQSKYYSLIIDKVATLETEEQPETAKVETKAKKVSKTASGSSTNVAQTAMVAAPAM